MPIVNKGWAYVSSSMAATDPGGNDTNIQFNNNGSFSGSALLITDGSGSLSASLNISASSFYGDGSNLTGLTASAVNVADGPEYSIQFRRDDPISGEISGSQNLKFISNNQLNLTGAMHVKDSAATATADPNYADIVIAKNGTAGVSVLSSDGTSAALLLGSPTDTSASQHLYAPAANYSQIGHARAGGYVKLTSGDSQEVLRLDANQHVTASGDITASGHISASSFTGQIFYGSGAGLTNTTIPSNATDNQVLIASSGFINANPANASLTSGRFDIGSSGFISAMTGALHVTGAGMVGNDSLFTVSGRDYGKIFEVSGSGVTYVSGNLQVCHGTASILHLSGCSPITVHAPMSSSYNISASAFYGNGAGITGISLINLDAAGSDTNIQFNQNGEFAADAGLVYDGSGSVTISGSYPPSEYIDPSFGLEVTESLGAKLTLGAWGNPYLQTLQYYATSSPGDPPEDAVTIGPFNRLQIYQDGQISLSSSANADPQFEMPAGIELVCNPGNGLVAVETNRVSFLHNTASLSTDEQEYLWSINSDHTDDEDESAWVKLDVDGKEFKVGGADSIKLVAAAGLQVDNSPTVINSALTSSGGAQFTADATFTAELNAYGNAQIGNASSDVLNVVSTATFDNMSDINSTAGNRTWKVASGSAATGSGPTQNGALLFFSQDGGATKDYLKFHTSGAAPGVVLASNVYMNNVGDNEEQPAGKLSFYVSSSNKGYVTRTTGQQVFNQAAGAGLTASNGQLSTITTVDTTIHQANFSIGSTKQLYLVRTNAAYTGALPTLTSDNQLGQTYVVKDWEGNAETNNICVSGASGQPVDGHGATKVATDYGSVTVCAISSSASGYAWVVIGQT